MEKQEPSPDQRKQEPNSEVAMRVMGRVEELTNQRKKEKARLTTLYENTTGEVDFFDLIIVYRFCQSPLAGDMPDDFHCSAEEAIQKVKIFLEKNVINQIEAMRELSRAGMLTLEKAAEVLLNMDWAQTYIGGNFSDILSYDKKEKNTFIYELWHECEKGLGVTIRRKKDEDCDPEILKWRNIFKDTDRQELLISLITLFRDGERNSADVLFLQDLLGFTVDDLESTDK